MKLTHPVHKTEGLVPPVGFGADQGAVARIGGKEAVFKLRERDVPHLGGVIFREAQCNAPCAAGVIFRAVDTHRDAIPRPAVAGEGRQFFQGADGLDILVKAVFFFPQLRVEDIFPGLVDGFPVPAGDLGKQGEGQGDPARDIFPPLKHLVGTDLQEGGVVQYQPAELLFRRDPQQLLVFLIPAGDKMALVALLHDLSVQITGQLLIQGGDERVLQGKAVDDVAEAVFQELTQKRRLWLTGVACQVGDHPVGVSGDVPQGIRYALSTVVCRVSVLFHSSRVPFHVRGHCCNTYTLSWF
uniref:Uncharacterized protein n=1 Tax=Escherichia coli TaxID=562 RepID=A0A8F1LAR5_ECOLX|nr:hypothetical protein IHCLGBEB_00141 [Escherichia coli]